MSEVNRRTLRNNRKPPIYLANQVNLLRLQQEEGGIGGNNRSGLTKELRYSPIQINALAKLLIRFINQTNLDLKNARKPISHQQVDKDKKNDNHIHSKNGKHEKSQPDFQKKSINNNREIDDEGSKKTVELYSFKGQHHNSDIIRNNLGSEGLKLKHTTIQQTPFNINMANQYIPCLNQFTQFHTLYPPDLKFNAIFPTQFMMSPNTFANMGNMLMSKHMMFSQMPFGNRVQKSQMGNNREVQKHQLASDTKLFKRSSFHVAIAYHIHIKKLKLSGRQLNDNDIDPTYQAKKLKQQKHKEFTDDNKFNGK